MLSVRAVTLREPDEPARERLCGFVKNEWVRAAAPQDAVAAARQKILAQLRKKPGLQVPPAQEQQFIVEEVEAVRGVWKLWRKQGFLFFDAAEADEPGDHWQTWDA